jgi:hypothetical protein
MRKLKLLAMLLGMALPALASAEEVPALYSHSATLKIASAGEPDWDYLRLDQASGRLFIARHDDGLTVVDVHSGKIVGQVGNSVGANGPLTVASHGRGFAAMTDGTALVFDMKTLKPIARPKLDPKGGEMDSATWDPASDHVLIASGRRETKSSWYILDAATGRLIGQRDFPSTKMDHPAFDGKGTVFAPYRDQNVILKLRSSDLVETGRYALGDCIEPSVLEMRRGSDDLLVACRGPKPVFIALDTASGKVKATLPIGRHADGMIVDEARHRIAIANGDDASLSVIGFGSDGYKPLGTVSTEPMARTMQIDERTGRLFLVTADYTLAPGAPEAEAVFHPGSFRLLTYTPVQ